MFRKTEKLLEYGKQQSVYAIQMHFAALAHSYIGYIYNGLSLTVVPIATVSTQYETLKAIYSYLNAH